MHRHRHDWWWRGVSGGSSAAAPSTTAPYSPRWNFDSRDAVSDGLGSVASLNSRGVDTGFQLATHAGVKPGLSTIIVPGVQILTYSSSSSLSSTDQTASGRFQFLEGTQPFTISTRVRAVASSLTSYLAFLSDGAAPGAGVNYLALAAVTGVRHLYIDRSNPTQDDLYQGSATYNSSFWFSALWTFDGSLMSLYLDNVLYVSGAAGGAITSGALQLFGLGCHPTDPHSGLVGYAGNSLAWDRVLTSTERAGMLAYDAVWT